MSSPYDWQTLADRLIAVLRTVADPKRPQASLEQYTGIKAQTWQNVVGKRQKPTTEQLEAVARVWPEYCAYLLTGRLHLPEQTAPRLEHTPLPDPGDIQLRRHGETSADDGEVVGHSLPSLSWGEAGPINWGYVGSGPKLLAWNVLMLHGLHKGAADVLKKKFTEDVIARLPIKSTVLPSTRVLKWLEDNATSVAWAMEMGRAQDAKSAAETTEQFETATGWISRLNARRPEDL